MKLNADFFDRTKLKEYSIADLYAIEKWSQEKYNFYCENEDKAHAEFWYEVKCIMLLELDERLEKKFDYKNMING